MGKHVLVLNLHFNFTGKCVLYHCEFSWPRCFIWKRIRASCALKDYVNVLCKLVTMERSARIVRWTVAGVSTTLLAISWTAHAQPDAGLVIRVTTVLLVRFMLHTSPFKSSSLAFHCFTHTCIISRMAMFQQNQFLNRLLKTSFSTQLNPLLLNFFVCVLFFFVRMRRKYLGQVV